MDFENQDPNLYYTQTQQEQYFPSKPIQNTYDQYQYTTYPTNEMGYSMPGNYNTSQNYIPQQPLYQNYPDPTKQMVYPVYNNYDNSIQNHCQMNQISPEYQQQYMSNMSNSMPVLNQNNMGFNNYGTNNLQTQNQTTKEEEEEKVDPDFKPDDLVEEESDDDDDDNEGIIIQIF